MILDILFNIFFIIMSIEDIIWQEIDEIYIRISFIIAVIKVILSSMYIETYISVSIYVLPFYIAYIVSVYLNKELVGLADFKIIVILALYMQNDSIIALIKFYFYCYLIALIYGIAIYKKSKYVPLIPCMYLAYIKGVYL